MRTQRLYALRSVVTCFSTMVANNAAGLISRQLNSSYGPRASEIYTIFNHLFCFVASFVIELPGILIKNEEIYFFSSTVKVRTKNRSSWALKNIMKSSEKYFEVKHFFYGA